MNGYKHSKETIEKIKTEEKKIEEKPIAAEQNITSILDAIKTLKEMKDSINK